MGPEPAFRGFLSPELERRFREDDRHSALIRRIKLAAATERPSNTVKRLGGKPTQPSTIVPRNTPRADPTANSKPKVEYRTQVLALSVGLRFRITSKTLIQRDLCSFLVQPVESARILAESEVGSRGKKMPRRCQKTPGTKPLNGTPRVRSPGAA